jgi:type VI secretion system secreted protein Hcp
MRRKALWGLLALALIVTPAVIGLIVIGGDSGRNQAALVQEGGPTAYQLTIAGITPAGQAIDVKSFSWGVSNGATIGSATTGAGAGKAKFDELVITKKIDEMSPLLYKAVAVGTGAPTAVLKLYKAGEKPISYMTYTMKQVFVSSLKHAGTADDVPNEQVTLIFGSNVLETTGDAGKAAAPFGWDVVMNRAAG